MKKRRNGIPILPASTSCYRKVRFTSRVFATMEAGRLNRENERVKNPRGVYSYMCCGCGYWHVTGAEQGGREKQQVGRILGESPGVRLS